MKEEKNSEVSILELTRNYIVSRIYWRKIRSSSIRKKKLKLPFSIVLSDDNCCDGKSEEDVSKISSSENCCWIEFFSRLLTGISRVRIL